MTVLRPIIKGQKVGSSLIPGNLHPFLKIIGILLPLIAYEIAQSIKTNHTIFWVSHLLRWPTFCRVCFFLNLTYLPIICLSLNSFCNETSRTSNSPGIPPTPCKCHLVHTVSGLCLVFCSCVKPAWLRHLSDFTLFPWYSGSKMSYNKPWAKPKHSFSISPYNAFFTHSTNGGQIKGSFHNRKCCLFLAN